MIIENVSVLVRNNSADEIVRARPARFEADSGSEGISTGFGQYSGHEAPPQATDNNTYDRHIDQGPSGGAETVLP